MKPPLQLLSLAAVLARGWAYKTVSDDTLRHIPGPGDDFDIHKGALLAPILRPRVSGTENNTLVLRHFIDFFKTNLPEWRLELHNSTSTTPTSHGKEIPFVNLIATRDPPGTNVGDVGRLAMVAHYDSKLTPKGFIGAIDSAAPCAMLMHMARTVDAALTKMWEAQKDNLNDLEGAKGVQILLLDGEEAFVSWTATDSLYGSRALASDWEHSYHPAMSTYRTPLDSIDLFVLLDLLGSAHPTVPSYFKTTHWAYKHMATIEERLRKLGLFKSSPNHPNRMAKRKNKKPREEKQFLFEKDKKNSAFIGGFVEDDHVPFMKRGVDILHLIPNPFPVGIWHEMADDGEHLDMDTVDDWTLLVTAFVAEWMDLEGFFDFKAQKRKAEEKTEL
ncbi:glutaminyl-peptide cyclotransferase precursor [Sporormia fimetaria CBS 119925]|uniref:Peptide hydrolase n=1 Tax=Sporormia fimetaria CBS 119925 TaxID=1340428 RepID=A0A6A6UZE5_9PLEO|nr:glutaminyl-peptide cyclotransferase precursor [Sporormia fimetaria CBS 119925]